MLLRLAIAPTSWVGAMRRGSRNSIGCALLVITSVLLAAFPDGSHAQQGIPATIVVPAGVFKAGSTRAEREAAYRLDERAYGHSRTRKNGWYDNELPAHLILLPAFRLTRTPITNAQYRLFVAATGHPAPDVDAVTWNSYGLVHPYNRTRRHAWRGPQSPPGREAHPVVLVAQADAMAYARWLSEQTGQVWRLPTELEWEKGIRGKDGRRFPWGDEFRPNLLNSHDRGPFDTLPVGRFESGRGPFGALDGAGQVFEWTATPAGPAAVIVKGGSWDDSGCGICRPAARHARPGALKHILIGFRLVNE